AARAAGVVRQEHDRLASLPERGDRRGRAVNRIPTTPDDAVEVNDQAVEVEHGSAMGGEQPGTEADQDRPEDAIQNAAYARPSKKVSSPSHHNRIDREPHQGHQGKEGAEPQ